jgi:hypothetical protein
LEQKADSVVGGLICIVRRFGRKSGVDLWCRERTLDCMNTSPAKKCSLLAALVLSLVLAAPVLADDHNYQVTGPVLAVTDTSITVKKGKDRFRATPARRSRVTSRSARR